MPRFESRLHRCPLRHKWMRLLGGGNWASSLLFSPQENNSRQDFQRPSDSLREHRLVSSEALIQIQKDKSKVVSSHPSPLLPSQSSSAGQRGLAFLQLTGCEATAWMDSV